MGWTPKPTTVPAAGDCVQVGTPQASEKHLLNWQRSGTMPLRQSLVRKRSRAKSRRQLQLSTGGVVSTTVTVWLHLATLPQSSTACQVWVMTHGQEPLVTVLKTVSVTPPFGV